MRSSDSMKGLCFGASENKYSNSCVCEDASACAGGLFSNKISQTSPPGSFSFNFFAAISSANACSRSCCYLRFLSFSLALCPRCAACSRFVLSCFFSCPRFNVGTQSTLYLSQLLAACPETKCLPHTRSLFKISSVRSALLIAEIQRIRLSLDSFSASSPWLIITEGIRAKYTPLSRPLLLPHPTIMYNTMIIIRTRLDFVYILVHQYGGVATVVKILVTWVKTIYSCWWCLVPVVTQHDG